MHVHHTVNSNSYSRGDVPGLIQGQPAAIVLPDAAALTDQDRAALDGWIRRGGVVIRFAGPRPFAVA